MTPEEVERRKKEILAQAMEELAPLGTLPPPIPRDAETEEPKSRELLPPLRMGGDRKPRLDLGGLDKELDLPPPIDAERVLGSAAPAPQQAPELLPPIPERDVPERHVKRTGSKAGRRAHKAFGALLAGLGGRNSYVDRVALENAKADEKYKDDLRTYGLQKQADVEKRKTQMDRTPVPDHLVKQFGLPIGTTYGQLKQYQQMGYGSLVRQRENIDAALAQEEARQAGRLGLEDEKQKNRLTLQQQKAADALALARAKKKGRGGGGGGGESDLARIARSAGITEEKAMEGLEDIGNGNRTSEAAMAVMMTTSNKTNKRIVDTFIKTGNVERRDIESGEKDLSKVYLSNSDTIGSLRRWTSFENKHKNEINGWLEEIKRDPSRTSWSQGARDMLNAMRPPIAAFLRQMAGAAMSPSEAGLHGGPAAKLLVEGDDKWTSVDGIASKIENYFARNQIHPSELFAVIDRVRNTVQEQMAAAARTAPTASLASMRPEDARPIIQDRLREGVNSGKVKIPAGGKLSPSSLRVDGHRIRYKVIMPDGSTQDGSF